MVLAATRRSHTNEHLHPMQDAEMSAPPMYNVARPPSTFSENPGLPSRNHGGRSHMPATGKLRHSPSQMSELPNAANWTVRGATTLLLPQPRQACVPKDHAHLLPNFSPTKHVLEAVK